MRDSSHADLLDQAVRNNALWCDAVCRAHRLPTTLDAVLWLCGGPPPPFYPSAVTLPATAAAQMAALAPLIAAGLRDGWTIKDSYGTLDLAPLGLRPLFDATWIGHAALPVQRDVAETGLRWTAIRTDAELEQWEAAWRGVPAGAAHDEGPRTFRLALLAEAGVVFVAGLQGSAVVAGAVANRTGDVVGLSNVFLPDDADIELRAGCFGAVAAQFPGLPVVGYERGGDLDAALALGFTALGPLRVWSYAGA